MKKLILTIILFTLMLMRVNAADFNTYITGKKSINANETFTVTIGVNNAKNLWGFKAPINYDKNKLSIISQNGLNGFGIAIGTNFVADNSNGKNGSFQVANITFKALSNFKIGDKTSISLGAAEGSDGETISTGNGSSLEVSIVKPKSGNNNLKSLNVSGQNINFSKGNLKYSLIVENDIDKITIKAAPEDSKASVSGVGTKNLKLYNNEFNVTVKAENGNTKNYVLEIIRKDIDGNIKELSKDNNLSNIIIENYDINFNKDILEYTILLKDDELLNIKADAIDQKANVTINNLEKYSYGNNIIEISVIAENEEEKIYKINAIKLKENNDTKAIKKDNNVVFYIIISIQFILILILSYVIYDIRRKK